VNNIYQVRSLSQVWKAKKKSLGTSDPKGKHPIAKVGQCYLNLK